MTESEYSSKRKWEHPKEQLFFDTSGDLAQFEERLIAEGPSNRLEWYNDTTRLWASLLEWLDQLQKASTFIAEKAFDAIAIMAVDLVLQADGQGDAATWSKAT